jgi:hypothetical protein
VFVNDGSTDRTGALIDAYAKREPRLRVLHNDRNRLVTRRAAPLVRRGRNSYSGRVSTGPTISTTCVCFSSCSYTMT